MLSSNAFLEEVKIFHWLFDNIDVESASKYVVGKDRIYTSMNISSSCIIHTVIVLCLPFPSIWTLSFASKLKAVKVFIGERGHHLGCYKQAELYEY